MTEQQTNNTPNNKNSGWMVIAAIVVFAGVAWFSFRVTKPQAPEQESRPSTVATAKPTTPAPVKYPTLSPALFDGKTREAYQAALDIPEVLKQVQCYCGCKQSAGHQNNLFCFTDDHGVG